MKNLEQFKKLFNPLPGNCYLQVTTEVDDTTIWFDEIIKKVDGRFNLALYSEDNLTDALFAKYENLQHIKEFSLPFRASPRDYDMVMLSHIFSLHENQEMILKLAYRALANTANIIIIEKKDLVDTALVKEMLEACEFRVANEIAILDDCDLIIAKKMHMWGNGL
ncbi:hypothetical protein [Sulfurimonas sp.]|uniref:hypothetical protein n=1 Tax=Sulfurimonas sp. TaxID=2022749 RepID=UPI00260A6551|nr:hypothetical protein [Sulfurimonas sp.]MDD5157851.1 hypothetical protein [Sulfurimonas sp.]